MAPTYSIIPFSKIIKLFSMTEPLPRCALAPLIAIRLCCAGAGVCCAYSMHTLKSVVMFIANVFMT